MTLRKNPMDWRSSLYEVVTNYPGGVPAMAARLDLSASTFYGILRGEERHELNVPRFNATLHFAAQAKVPNCKQPLHALCAEHGGIFIELPSLNSDADEKLTRAMLKAVKEFGDLAGEATQRISDGDVSNKDLDAIEREGYEAMHAIAAFIELARAAHAAGGKTR